MGHVTTNQYIPKMEFNLSYIITTWHVLTYLKSLGEEKTIARNRQPSMIQMHVPENPQNLKKKKKKTPIIY